MCRTASFVCETLWSRMPKVHILRPQAISHVLASSVLVSADLHSVPLLIPGKVFQIVERFLGHSRHESVLALVLGEWSCRLTTKCGCLSSMTISLFDRRFAVFSSTTPT